MIYESDMLCCFSSLIDDMACKPTKYRVIEGSDLWSDPKFLKIYLGRFILGDWKILEVLVLIVKCFRWKIHQGKKKAFRCESLFHSNWQDCCYVHLLILGMFCCHSAEKCFDASVKFVNGWMLFFHITSYCLFTFNSFAWPFLIQFLSPFLMLLQKALRISCVFLGVIWTTSMLDNC